MEEPRIVARIDDVAHVSRIWLSWARNYIANSVPFDVVKQQHVKCVGCEYEKRSSVLCNTKQTCPLIPEGE
jgi:hypothetical protein